MKREIQKPRMTRASDDWFCGEKSPVTDRDKNSHLPLRSQFV